MTTPVRAVEEFFLKIFKVTVLLTMTLALLAVVALGVIALQNYLQTPKEPAPAQKARARDITIDDLIRSLPPAQEEKEAPRAPLQQPPTLRYLEQATELYRCSVEFAGKVGAEIVDTDLTASRRVEELRAQIENAAGRPDHGATWVKSLVTFTCGALRNETIMSLWKEKKVKSVFWPTIRFHLAKWGEIQSEKRAFEDRENNRVAQERGAENARVLTAKAAAVVYITAAGIAFAAFMTFALYLLAAKIESNLRDINASIQATASEQSST